jgi:hypothetical protein
MLGNVIYVNNITEELLLSIADLVTLMHVQDAMLDFKYLKN